MAATSSRALPRPPSERHGLPGRGALAPAAAVVAVAALGAMVASGVFGGNDPSPALDTGIVPMRALQAVPEGEAAEVVDDLRSAASEARRRRLADRRQALAEAQLAPEPEPEATTDEPEAGTTGGTGDTAEDENGDATEPDAGDTDEPGGTPAPDADAEGTGGISP